MAQDNRFSEWNEHVAPRYTINRTIGIGAYGQVVEAYDTQEKRNVAMKKISSIFEDLIDCKRVLREIAILNRLVPDEGSAGSVPVVQLLNLIVPPNLENFNEMYLVLEIADTDFKRLFRNRAFLSDLHVQTLMYHLILGVKFIHSAGIVHRDLKPANCLVNQDCTVKICDFGLARTMDTTRTAHDPIPEEDQLPSDHYDMPETMSNQRLSTAKVDHSVGQAHLTSHVVTRWYRAPELCLLQRQYTAQIDAWSLGCIFGELLQCIDKNLEDPDKRAPLFPGAFCFPLTPPYRQHQRTSAPGSASRQIYQQDQLVTILQMLETSEEDFNYLDENAAKYVAMVRKEAGGGGARNTSPERPLRSRFAGSSPEAIDLLRQMLHFNPEKRITVDQMLNHPYFNPQSTQNTQLPFRRWEREPTARHLVQLPFEDHDMTQKELRYYLLKEVQRFNPSLEIPSILIPENLQDQT